MAIDIVWFKRDLRIWDNEVFTNACENGPIIPLYIVEPELWSQDDLSYRHYQFLMECLDDLTADVQKLGQELIFEHQPLDHKGTPLEIDNDDN